MRLGARRRSNIGILFTLKKLHKIPIQIIPNNNNIYARYYGNTIEKLTGIIKDSPVASITIARAIAKAIAKRYRIPGSIAAA